MRRLRPTTPFIAPSLGLLALLGFGAGCDLLPDEQHRSVINLYAAHTPTPENGIFPDHGPEGYRRNFPNDLGWKIDLGAAVITTSRVSVIPCGQADGHDVDMYFGPCAEDFIAIRDGTTVGLGAVTATDGYYCSIEVEFDNYYLPEEDSQHAVPGVSEIVGNSIHISGTASNNSGDTVDFAFTSDQPLKISIDISNLEEGGSPVRLSDENFAKKLTIAKVYDRMFDGIDFATFTQADLEAAILSSIENDTYAVIGTKL